MPRLSCVYRKTGQSLFGTYEHALPAEFHTAQQIACPVPAVYYAEDGSISTKMFFSATNDGETYRYSSFKFTFVGGCKVSAFTRTMYTIIYSLASLIGIVVFGCLLLVVCRRRRQLLMCVQECLIRVGLLEPAGLLLGEGGVLHPLGRVARRDHVLHAPPLPRHRRPPHPVSSVPYRRRRERRGAAPRA